MADAPTRPWWTLPPPRPCWQTRGGASTSTDRGGERLPWTWGASATNDPCDRPIARRHGHPWRTHASACGCIRHPSAMKRGTAGCFRQGHPRVRPPRTAWSASAADSPCVRCRPADAAGASTYNRRSPLVFGRVNVVYHRVFPCHQRPWGQRLRTLDV